MKICFVCRSNVGRSQMAMEFWNRLHPGEADSAGTDVDIPGQKLKERSPAVEVVEVMKELGIDMSENTRTQLTPEMAAKYDQVIVMAEPESIPGWLRGAPNAVIWDNVQDARNQIVPVARKIRDDIKSRVEGLSVTLGHSGQK